MFLGSVRSEDVQIKVNYDALNKDIVDNQIEEAKQEDEYTPARR